MDLKKVVITKQHHKELSLKTPHHSVAILRCCVYADISMYLKRQLFWSPFIIPSHTINLENAVLVAFFLTGKKIPIKLLMVERNWTSVENVFANKNPPSFLYSVFIFIRKTQNRFLKNATSFELINHYFDIKFLSCKKIFHILEHFWVLNFCYILCIKSACCENFQSEYSRRKSCGFMNKLEIN